jgi:hypothetical protein
MKQNGGENWEKGGTMKIINGPSAEKEHPRIEVHVSQSPIDPNVTLAHIDV